MKAGIIGGTGYTGRELVRILLRHKEIKSVRVYGRTHGRFLSEDIPELRGIYDGKVLSIETEKIIKENDVLFIALPHKVSMEISPVFQNRIPLFDLSADYRLKTAEEYEKWYQTPHLDKDYLGKYVYGLPEMNREKLKGATLVACAGCYPTSVILAVLPLIEKGLVENTVIADSKSGHSGAGKKLTEMTQAGQTNENIQPYKILNHQHKGEIEQVFEELNRGNKFYLTFTPQVMDFDRGILSSVYADLKEPLSQSQLDDIYRTRYGKEPFIRLYTGGTLPSVKLSVHTNFCDISCVMDERIARVTIISCIDNLIKGASGQAVQVMNIAMGFDEKEGLIN
ncbi:MAG: N-acetyl-gamma-glutamyl-phosphate reductase [Candidatus Aureabacteria bacterium]|nr:N-acetyl-gamma-glutamyl-phosphate reductase [Candidatus Auribacterota bacterium]